MSTNAPGYYTGLSPAELSRRMSPSYPSPTKLNSFTPTISKQSFFKAEQTASPDFIRPSNRLKKLHQEKLQLHQKSMEMVSKWNNTISGQRKYRLAAQLEKARLAEEQRIQTDKEWAQFKENERQEMVNRAKQLQYKEDIQVRKLHSKALMSQVLKERDAQRAYKQTQRQKERLEMDRFLSSQKMDIECWQSQVLRNEQRQHEERMAIATENRSLAHHHQQQLQQLEKEPIVHPSSSPFSWPTISSASKVTSSNEFATKESLKHSEMEELKRALDEHVQAKLEKKKTLLETEKDMERIHSQIHHVKHCLATKRLEKEKEMIRERILRNEQVSQQLLPIHAMNQSQRDTFLAKIEKAHQGEFEAKQRHQQEQRTLQTQACTNESFKMINLKRQEKEKEKEIGLYYRDLNESVAKKARRSAEQRYINKQTIQAQFGETYRQVMDQQKQEQQRQEVIKAQAHQLTLHQCEKKETEFQQYATDLMKELKAMNNATDLIQKELNEMQLDPRSKNMFTDREVDTFERMGWKKESNASSLT